MTTTLGRKYFQPMLQAKNQRPLLDGPIAFVGRTGETLNPVPFLLP